VEQEEEGQAEEKQQQQLSLPSLRGRYIEYFPVLLELSLKALVSGDC